MLDNLGNAIMDMYDLQNGLNKLTNGVNWKSGVTTEGRKINWLRCIRVEAAELIDSLNYKHWKDIKAPNDWANAEIEAVDIWHFIMSEALTMVHDENDFLALSMDTLDYAIAGIDGTVPKDSRISSDVLDRTDDLIEATFSKDLEKILLAYFALLASLGMSGLDLYKTYVVKNTLNKFRQDNGYKEGSYIKMINGEEDNIHMFRLMDEHNCTTNELYTLYAAFYAKVKNEN